MMHASQMKEMTTSEGFGKEVVEVKGSLQRWNNFQPRSMASRPTSRDRR